MPFRVFGSAARPASLPTPVVLLWNRVLVQSIRPGKYHRHCFDDPALPLALASAMRFSSTGLPPNTIKFSATSSRRTSPSFRVLPSNTYLTAAAARSSHGLCFPTAHGRIRGPLTASAKPLAKFRLQGLVTLLTAYALESRAGFVSHRQRSWDSPFGGFPSRKPSRPFSHEEPTPFGSAVIPPQKRRTGPRSLGFWVHLSRKCLAEDGLLSRQPPAPPMGFAPLGPACKDLDGDFSAISSHTLHRFGDYSPNPPASQSIYGPLPRLTRPSTEVHSQPRPPLWGFRTCLFLGIRAGRRRGYEFTSRRAAHYCQPHRRS